MKNYEKPVVMINEELAEGVYAASGSGCMTVTTYISQQPSQNYANKYAVWIESNHDGSLYNGDGHTASGITVTLYFNQAVTCEDNDFYQSENIPFTVTSGNGTPTITVHFDANVPNAGTKFWGQIYVSSEAGLALTGSTITCHSVY